MNSLVLIHGFLGSPADWGEVQSSLSCVSDSITIPSANCWQSGIEAICRDLPPDCVIVGYSMGARVALGCALADSERKIRAAVFVSGNPGLAGKFRENRWQKDLEVCEMLARGPIDEFLRRWYRQTVFQPRNAAEINSLVAQKVNLDRQRQIELMRTYSVAKQPNYWAGLSELKIPVAVVAGELDDKYVDISRQMVERIPKAELHLAANCGHIVHRERPMWFVSMLEQFVTRLPEES
ncbi:MAG: alpha/beta fold hydrolase [Pirellulaceae bacterium]|nr:alpha/beta fold hydrolase [Pirellulaceae bacterium]